MISEFVPTIALLNLCRDCSILPALLSAVCVCVYVCVCVCVCGRERYLVEEGLGQRVL